MAENVAQPVQNTHFYNLSQEDVLKQLQTQKTGLTEEDAVKRQQAYGPNTLTAKKRISALHIFLSQFNNILILILLASALLILFVYFFGEKDPSDLVEAGLIVAITLMITILGFVQEYKAEKAVESLKKLLAFSAKVIRDGKEMLIQVEKLVPGDIVILEEGEKTPSDIRLLDVFSLQTIESSLTGESTPVNKTHEAFTDEKQIADQKNMVFSGTIIASGRGIGVVTAIGNQTEIGKIAQSVAETVEGKTPLQKHLDSVGKKIGLFVLSICIGIFFFIFFFAADFTAQPLLQKILHSFIASVALAVAAIPEGLPAVVTIALALGTQRMLRKNALVRKLNSVETLGSTDVICSDKTGTLTKGEMTVQEIYCDSTFLKLTGTGYGTTGQILMQDNTVLPPTLPLLLEAGVACNNARLAPDGKILGDPTEAALLVSAAKGKVTSNTTRVFEIPFSSLRKMMTVVVRKEESYLVFTKGAPEVLLSRATTMVSNGKTVPLTQSEQENVLAVTHSMSQKALRTLGFAYKILSEEEYTKQVAEANQLENDLVFLGLQGMIDPPRQEVKDLIASCSESGIRVIMITGDHLDTAKAVAEQIGLSPLAVTGAEVDKMDERAFADAVRKVNVYARVDPSIKTRIVDVLKKENHIVAMTGDGVNDAPALKKADIGIAMGITGTDVAKEASDMVLLDDHFGTIVKAVEEGRGIYQNIRKFVQYLLSCNLAEVLVVLGAILFFRELPLSATMLLWINVVTDGLPAIALGIDPYAKKILAHQPREFQGAILDKRVWIEMLIFAVLLTFGVLFLFFINLPEGIEEAKGVAFVAIVIFELVNVFLVRTKYNTPFFANKWLIIAVLGTLILQILVVSAPFTARLFEVKHIDAVDWLTISIASLLLFLVFRLMQAFLNKIPSLTDSQQGQTVVTAEQIPYTG